jgi:hypothetical protein
MKPQKHEEPVLTGQISIVSLLVCVGILALAIVNQYLAQ